MSSKGGKMQQYLNYRMRLVLGDGRELIGQLMAFDKHMNVVIGDVEEYRRVGGRAGKEAQVLKRSLGLLLLRGESIVSLSVEGPPPPDSARSRTALPGIGGGPGLGRAAGRGVALPPVVAQAASASLNAPNIVTGAPVRGLGGPAPSAMQPRGPPPPGFPPGPPGFMAPPPGFRGIPMAPPPGFPPGMGLPPPVPPGMGPPPGFRGGPMIFPPGMGPQGGFGRGQ